MLKVFAARKVDRQTTPTQVFKLQKKECRKVHWDPIPILRVLRVFGKKLPKRNPRAQKADNNPCPNLVPTWNINWALPPAGSSLQQAAG